MWQQPLILSYFLLWCSPRLCSRPSTRHRVHYPSQHALWSLPFPSTTILTQMTLNSASLFTHSSDSSISHLQNALQHISSWMTANLLTLNSSKTEFLLLGLKNQLAKIQNSSLDTSHVLCSISCHNLWRTFYFLWQNCIFIQSLLLSHSSASLYPALSRFLNCLYHCYIYRSLQTWLL